MSKLKLKLKSVSHWTCVEHIEALNKVFPLMCLLSGGYWHIKVWLNVTQTAPNVSPKLDSLCSLPQPLQVFSVLMPSALPSFFFRSEIQCNLCLCMLKTDVFRSGAAPWIRNAWNIGLPLIKICHFSMLLSVSQRSCIIFVCLCPYSRDSWLLFAQCCPQLSRCGMAPDMLRWKKPVPTSKPLFSTVPPWATIQSVGWSVNPVTIHFRVLSRMLRLDSMLGEQGGLQTNTIHQSLACQGLSWLQKGRASFKGGGQNNSQRGRE